jgi:hypothetical protein
VRVDEDDAHAVYGSNSVSGSSKSGPISISPASTPSRTGACSAAIATSRAAGLPLRAMMTSSPLGGSDELAERGLRLVHVHLHS